MDREKLLRIQQKCKKYATYMSYMSLIVLTFLLVQIEIFQTDMIDTTSLSTFPKVLAVSGIGQIFIFLLFIYLEEGSLEAFKNSVVQHVFKDYKTTLMMAIPPTLLVNSYALLYLSISIIPEVAHQSYKFNIFGVAIFAVLVLKKKFYLSQILALYFIAKALTFVPSEVEIESNPDQDTVFIVYGHLFVIGSILAYGLSYIMLEKILKSSEVSLWIRGIQLNIFAVPLTIAVSYYFDSMTENNSRGYFDNFNIIGWFFVVFKIAQQMMELFVIRVSDSICRMLALSAAVTIVGAMKNPFNLEIPGQASKLAVGLALAGICLYTVMDHFPKWGELMQTEPIYRPVPPSYYNDTSKIYQPVPTVSSKIFNMHQNADTFLNLIDEDQKETTK